MNYTIIKIDEEKGTVTVAFDIDGIEQTMAAPLDDKRILEDFLINYGIAYEAGLSVSAPLKVDPEITKMVGKPVAVSEAQISAAKIGKIEAEIAAIKPDTINDIIK